MLQQLSLCALIRGECTPERNLILIKMRLKKDALKKKNLVKVPSESDRHLKWQRPQWSPVCEVHRPREHGLRGLCSCEDFPLMFYVTFCEDLSVGIIIIVSGAKRSFCCKQLRVSSQTSFPFKSRLH